MSSLEKEGICDDAIENMKKFRQTNYLKKLALELVARSLDTEQIRQLEQCFVAVGESLFINIHMCMYILSCNGDGHVQFRIGFPIVYGMSF